MELKPFMFGFIIAVVVFLAPDIILSTLSTQGTMAVFALIMAIIYIKTSKNEVTIKDFIKVTLVITLFFSLPLFFSTEGTIAKQMFYPILAIVVNSIVVFIPMYGALYFLQIRNQEKSNKNEETNTNPQAD